MLKKLLNRIRNDKQETIEDLRNRGVQIGENVDILNSNIDGGQGFLISIGNNVTITGATLLAHDASTKKFLGYSKVGRIDIGDDVFIGLGAIVLPNTKIGNKVIVGAGSVVGKDIPDNSVVVGNPARVISTFDEYIEKNKKLMQTNPVYNTYAYQKTTKEKEEMKSELEGKIGFDL